MHAVTCNFASWSEHAQASYNLNYVFSRYGYLIIQEEEDETVKETLMLEYQKQKVCAVIKRMYLK